MFGYQHTHSKEYSLNINWSFLFPRRSATVLGMEVQWQIDRLASQCVHGLTGSLTLILINRLQWSRCDSIRKYAKSYKIKKAKPFIDGMTFGLDLERSKQYNFPWSIRSSNLNFNKGIKIMGSSLKVRARIIHICKGPNPTF